MRTPLSLKLGITLALVGVLSAVLTGYYAFRASRSQLVGSAQTELLTATQMLARRITQTGEDIDRDLRLMVDHPATLQALASAGAGRAAAQDEVAVLMTALMRLNPAYAQVRLISESDHGLEQVRIDRQVDGLRRVPADELQEKGHLPYVAETLPLPRGHTYVSRIAINHENGGHVGREQPGLQLAAPVFDPQGHALGLVVINTGLHGLFAMLEADLPSEFRVFLANGAGDVLVHPDADKTFGWEKGRRVLIQDDFPATAALLQGRQESVVFDASLGAEPVVAAFVGLPLDSPDNDDRLLLGLARPAARLVAASTELGTRIVQIVGALSVLGLVVALLLARAIARPLKDISDAAQALAEGREALPLPLKRRDEIGLLARSFEQMRAQLGQQFADLQAQRQRLEHLSQHDILTDLPNRRLFHERLERAIAYARRYDSGVCVLFLDLDDFKAINDAHGHDAGDTVLRAVAQRLTAMTREVDTVARLGGDEFVLLLGAPPPDEQIGRVAEKLLQGLRVPITVGDLHLHVGASIGISCYPQDGVSVQELMAHADQAMYAAKQGGGAALTARYRFYSSPPRPDRAQRGQQEADPADKPTS